MGGKPRIKKQPNEFAQRLADFSRLWGQVQELSDEIAGATDAIEGIQHAVDDAAAVVAGLDNWAGFANGDDFGMVFKLLDRLKGAEIWVDNVGAGLRQRFDTLDEARDFASDPGAVYPRRIHLILGDK